MRREIAVAGPAMKTIAGAHVNDGDPIADGGIAAVAGA